LGQEGKAQALLIPRASEKEVLRGWMSSRVSLSRDGGGALGTSESNELKKPSPIKLSLIAVTWLMRVGLASLGVDLILEWL
jgi:hypothetical protein